MSAWLQYQSLWDMPVSAVRTRLGSDVSLWCQMLTEAKAARAVVESSSREKAFGPVIVDYSSVQAKVTVKEHRPNVCTSAHFDRFTGLFSL